MGNPPEQSWSENHMKRVEETAKNGVKIIKKGKKTQKICGGGGTGGKNRREKPKKRVRIKRRN